jgi:hypothetical protein
MDTGSRSTWSANLQRGLLVLAAALPIVSIFVPWGYSYLPLHNPQDPPDPTTIFYIVPWDRWTDFLDTWLHASYHANTRYTEIGTYGAFLFGPPLLLAILAVWNLVRGRRTALALRWALVITGILGLLWTGVQWIYVIATNYKSATAYGTAIAAAGFLYALLAGLCGWVSRPAKASSAPWYATRTIGSS